MPCFINKFYLKFNNCNISKFESPGSVFRNNLRDYNSLYLKDIYSVDEDFDVSWFPFSQNVTELVLKNCSCISDQRFINMLHSFSNVTTIKLYGQLTLKGVRPKNLTILDLTESNLNFEDALSMISDLPALEKVCINWDTVIDIENVARNAVQRLTISFLQAICSKRDLIKLDLFLPVPFYGEEILRELAILINIRLDKFSLKTAGDIPIEIYQQFFRSQTYIKELELQNSRALTQATLSIVVENLKHLKSISLPSGSPYFETPLEIIRNLPIVEKLSIKVHFEVGDDRKTCLTKDIFKHDSLRQLILPNIHTQICNDSLYKAVCSVPNLQVLDLSFSRLNDKGLTMIFNKLTQLKELILDKCSEVSN